MRLKLSAANPYLRDPALRERMVFKSVASSSAIEGILAPFRHMAHESGAAASASVAGLDGKNRSTRFKT